MCRDPALPFRLFAHRFSPLFLPPSNGAGALALLGCEAGCASTYTPVCGKDGRTYANTCVTSCQGVAVVHNGVCKGEWALLGANLAFPRQAGARWALLSLTAWWRCHSLALKLVLLRVTPVQLRLSLPPSC